MSIQTELRERITNQIVAALRSGQVPFWRRPWALGQNAGWPTNIVSGKSYQGINTLLLSLAAMEKGYESKWWGTYQQFRSLSGQVRRGEKSSTIILYKPVHKVTLNDQGEEAVESFPIMRAWSVFNVAQVDGDTLDKYRDSARPNLESNFVDCDHAEEVFAATAADVRHGGGRAFYSPEGDFIQLPPREAFKIAHEYYGVLGHETVHWSGHKSRLNRIDKLARFGSESYAVEELVAELGSAFLLAELNIPQSDDLSNVTAYLGHWLGVLERDHFAIFTASSAASKAVDFVLGFSRQAEAQDEEPGTVEPVGVAG